MSLVFYYSPMSSSVTVHWALEELGVPYEKVKLDLQARDQDKPAYRALNPNGKVPLLVHDGTPIFESVAILLHLGETFGVDRKLFPAAGLARAEVTKWLVWAGVTLGEAVQRHQRNVAERFPADQKNARAAEVAKADVESLFGILDRDLEAKKKSWLVGDRFSLADLYVGSFVEYLGMLGFDSKPWPNLDAWCKRCTSRPAHAIAFKP
jgi:glutathione S-transferase